MFFTLSGLLLHQFVILQPKPLLKLCLRMYFLFLVPGRILTDRGSHFNSNMMKSLYGILGIEKLTTSAYRPSTNGRCERFHRFLNSALTFCCKKADQSDWDIAVPAISFSYRMSDSETIVVALSKLFLGSRPR